MSPEDPWAYVRKFPDKCSHEVSRGGEVQPCERTAYAVAFDEEGYWPVCIHHARLWKSLVTLQEVLQQRGEVSSGTRD